MAVDRLENIVSLAKRRGFVYPSSEIYGGLRASWDYGPLGVELKNNVKRQWWKSMVMGREDVVGLDEIRIDRDRQPVLLGDGSRRLLRTLHRLMPCCLATHHLGQPLAGLSAHRAAGSARPPVPCAHWGGSPPPRSGRAIRSRAGSRRAGARETAGGTRCVAEPEVKGQQRRVSARAGVCGEVGL